MTRFVVVALGLMLSTWQPVPAEAQSLGGSVYVTYGKMQFASGETFNVITGSRETSVIGFGAIFTEGSAFLDVGFSQRKLKGERVFVDQGNTFPLGIPARVTLSPFDLVAGWKSQSRLSPYVGGGFTMMFYKEESDFADATENVSERKAGAVLLAGVDVTLVRLLHVGGELRYRAVSGVLGKGGVSQVYEEDQLGGLVFGIRASIGR